MSLGILYLEPVHHIIKENAVYSLFVQPTFIAGILLSYLYFVLKCGPKHMEKRSPYSLSNTMVIYNAGQVIFNLWIAKLSIQALLENGSIISCTAPTLFGAYAHFAYIVNKYCDLLDTIIFVFRKNYNQITFLHVYHHTVIIIATTMGFYLMPGSMGLMPVLLNALVHIVMYLYYAISVYVDKNERSKYNFLKKRVTQMQLIQFIIIVWHFTRCLLGFCEYSTLMSVLGILQSTMFFYLFTKFYLKAYLKKSASKSK